MELYTVFGIAKYITIEHVVYVTIGFAFIAFIATGISMLKQCMNLAKKVKK